MNGRGIGPGGIRDHFQMSLSRRTTGIAMRPTHVYQDVRTVKKDIAM